MTHQGIQQFVLPDVGEGLTEAEILTWHVQPGDQVDVNQVICEIETAKAVVELPSPFAGRVEALLVEAGETVPVGTPIIAVDTGGAAGEPRPEPAPAAAPAEPPPRTAMSQCSRAAAATTGIAAARINNILIPRTNVLQQRIQDRLVFCIHAVYCIIPTCRLCELCAQLFAKICPPVKATDFRILYMSQ